MELATICGQVVDLVTQTAVFIRNEAGRVLPSQIETKQRNHLVSYVDKKSEQLLIEGLRRLLPEAGFVAEEGSVEQQLDRAWQWVIDPLDGTTNFLHQLPVYAISVGLLHEGEPVLGVVYEVNNAECFWAWKGGGAYLNGQKISVTISVDFQLALFGTGFPYYDFSAFEQYISVLRQLMQHTKGVRRFGAAAVDLCYVACGRFDGFFEHSLSIWDVAGGAVIVTEAGGRIADFKGGRDFLWGREIVVAAPCVWEQFFEIVHTHLGAV